MICKSLPQLTVPALTLAASVGFIIAPALVRASEPEPPYTADELAPFETDINQSVTPDAQTQLQLPEALEALNLYSEDEYDLYEGIDTYDRRPRPEQPDIYNEQPSPGDSNAPASDINATP